MSIGRDRLESAGLRYWDYARSHSRPLRILFGEDSLSDEARAVEILRSGTAAGVRASLERLFSEPGDVLISGEGLSALSADALLALRDLSGRAVKVIVYVREPCSWFTSGIQQNIKGGMTLEASLASRTGYNRLRRLTDVFGKDVDARLYRSSPDGKDLIHDFLSAMNLPRGLMDDFITAPVNIGLSNRAVWLLEAINRRAEREGL
ncbi:MAG: hypothetical protein ACR2FH_02125, partial [Caulobacteraceae bacterium]